MAIVILYEPKRIWDMVADPKPEVTLADTLAVWLISRLSTAGEGVTEHWPGSGVGVGVGVGVRKVHLRIGALKEAYIPFMASTVQQYDWPLIPVKLYEDAVMMSFGSTGRLPHTPINTPNP